MNALRLPYYSLSSSVMESMKAALGALENGPLDNVIIELAFLRVSQINGCAYCLDMHSKALRKMDVEQTTLDQLAGWQVSHAYSERERAALAWAESLTLIVATGAPDSAFEPLKAQFSDVEISELTFAISLMNAFNRLAVGMRQ
ncbi:carboxymuconolactone decarboxylase family protein [Rahnella perminowiae]|uniref:carboxymuconolactone decarboxylase family protein n=1 Tax=Rahnella perminowiae TaxID=2816244 RepID=UPI001C27801F|nr:carboxymuconolactone decarboxylase family protein [Rahnella perminowiae]MBU9825979.1 carboxymuconolactone decarboxylase family protein [Rahnella perminowiae]